MNDCGAEFRQSKAPGVGKNLCEATITRPAVVFAFSAIPRNAAGMALCALAREKVASAMRRALIARHGPSWWGGGGALQARSALTNE